MFYDLVLQPLRRSVVRYGKRLRSTFNRYVSRFSLVGDPAVFPPGTFSWTATLEARWEAIRDEAERLLLERRSEIPPLSRISPDHRRLDGEQRWRTFFLWGYGYRIDANCRLAPRTAALVEQVPGLLSALFSIHEPGTHLPRHRGVTKGMITCHLPLRVPADGQRCRIAVEDRSYGWTPGRFFVFDDTREHEVWNETGEDRVILLIHVRRPLRAPGRWVQNAVYWLIRMSPFVQDARRNLEDRTAEA